MRYQAKERLKESGGSEWLFEERSTPLAPTNMLLVCVIIGKFKNNERLINVLRTTPIRLRRRGNFDMGKAATYNLIEGKETII